jgi:hypothetical protein
LKIRRYSRTKNLLHREVFRFRPTLSIAVQRPVGTIAAYGEISATTKEVVDVQLLNKGRGSVKTSRPISLQQKIDALVAYLYSPPTNLFKLHHRYSQTQHNPPQTQPQHPEPINMPSSGKANVTKGPSANTRSAGKHQDFLNKTLTGRAAKRAEKKQQDKRVNQKQKEVKAKAKGYFASQ